MTFSLSDGLDDGLDFNDGLELDDGLGFDETSPLLSSKKNAARLKDCIEQAETKDSRWLLYHAESDDYMEVFTRQERDDLLDSVKTGEDILDVSGFDNHEKEFAKREKQQTETKAGRVESDFYPTPLYVVEDFLKALNATSGILRNFLDRDDGSYILDPCAGGICTPGNIQRAPYVQALRNAGVAPGRIISLDIREDANAGYRGFDFIKDPYPLTMKPAIVMSNPPFRLAKEFVDRALEVVDDEGYVIFFLRLNFFGSQERYEWWQDRKPYKLFIHPKRPSFVKGATDSCDYAHMIWKKNTTNAYSTVLEWVPPP